MEKSVLMNCGEVLRAWRQMWVSILSHTLCIMSAETLILWSLLNSGPGLTLLSCIPQCELIQYQLFPVLFHEDFSSRQNKLQSITTLGPCTVWKLSISWALYNLCDPTSTPVIRHSNWPLFLINHPLGWPCSWLTFVTTDHSLTWPLSMRTLLWLTTLLVDHYPIQASDVCFQCILYDTYSSKHPVV